MQHSLYPIHLKLTGKRVLVVGGGRVASRRVPRLVDCGAHVTIVSPDLAPELQRFVDHGSILWVDRRFLADDVEGATLVIAATGDRGVLTLLEELSQTRSFLFNCAADEARGDVHVPAVVEHARLDISVSTGGVNPAAAKRVRDALATWCERHRKTISAVLDTPRGAATPAIGESTTRAVSPGWVYLVGGGPGASELVTLRGYEVLQSADVVFYDRLVSDSVVALAAPTAEKVYVGKEVGHAHRANIAELMVQAARDGRCVARLKGGDPMVFGRGGEELLALRRARVPFEIVPGISSLSAVPAAAEIPVTYRGVASELVIRSGHRLPAAEGRSAFEASAGTSQRTYVYFMAVSRLQHVVEELCSEGVSLSTPAAIIENGTLPDQRVLTSELGKLATLARESECSAPALIVVGEVVLLRELDRVAPFLQDFARSQLTSSNH